MIWYVLTRSSSNSNSKNLQITYFFIVEGPRIVRLAAVVDRGFKTGSALNVNVFGSVQKGEL